jgi:hypothetical protein
MAASDQIVISQRKDHIGEGSRHVLTATFRDRATAANVTPTNCYYRLDCLTTGREVLDWTSVSADDVITLTITPTQNTLQSQCNSEERKRVTVAADYGLSTQFVDHIEYDVENEKDIG